MSVLKRCFNNLGQVYFWEPLRQNPLFFVFGYGVFVINICFMVAITDAAFLPIPNKGELNVTEGRIESVVRKTKGAHLVVRERKTNKVVIFPNRHASLPLGKASILMLEQRVGETVEILWNYRFINTSLFIKNKSVWHIEFDDGVFSSYETLATNKNNGRQNVQKVFLGLLVVNLLLIAISWFRYKEKANT